jgi:signal transduction histidine kinase/ActR/RegA family two-component response regulator
MPALLLGLGAVSVILLFLNNSIREHVLIREVEVARQVEELETQLATLHLWVEEYVTGDSGVLGEVWRREAAGRRLMHELETGAFDDEEHAGAAGELLAAIAPQVERFIVLSSERLAEHDRGGDVGVGSRVDVAYDAVFSALSADLRRLNGAMDQRLAAAHERSRSLFLFILLAWSAIVGVAVAAVWTRENRRMIAEEALRRSEAKLLQAQKMEAIGSLAGGLAHDINNYLAAISAQCEVVSMRAAPDDPLHAKMDVVMETCGRASGLLQRLLAFSRGQPIQPEVVSLNRVIRGIEEMIRRLLGEAIEIEVELADSLWTTEIEVSQVEQSVLNLLVNARDAMPQGGSVRIATRNVAATDAPLTVTGDCVALRVSDTGPGVPKELRDKIFEPFFTTKGKNANSGLGLATVYGIVGQNGGVIELVDEPGRGATFDVLFPRCFGVPELGPQRESEISAAPAGARILLVEDNEELRQSTVEILGELGFEVVAAADGPAAIEVFESAEQAFHLLLTDVVMPGMNGSELAEEIVTRDPAVRVLYASGYTDHVVLSHGVDEKALNFLPKPYSARALSQAIDRLLSPR